MIQPDLKVLLISKRESDWTHVRAALLKRGWHCWTARSLDQVIPLSACHSFNLILSKIWFGDSLTSGLETAQVSAFFCYPVRNGCWWIPLLRNGRRCYRDPALRPYDFARVLDRLAVRVCPLKPTLKKGPAEQDAS